MLFPSLIANVLKRFRNIAMKNVLDADIKLFLKHLFNTYQFFQSLLSDVDAVLYVDTDTLFLGPLEQIWEHFKKMNSVQIAALAPEQEEPYTGWYDRFAKHPFYKPLGN